MDYRAHEAFTAQSAAGPSSQGYPIHQDVEVSTNPFSLLESFNIDGVGGQSHAGMAFSSQWDSTSTFTESSNQPQPPHSYSSGGDDDMEGVWTPGQTSLPDFVSGVLGTLSSASGVPNGSVQFDALQFSMDHDGYQFFQGFGGGSSSSYMGTQPGGSVPPHQRNSSNNDHHLIFAEERVAGDANQDAFAAQDFLGAGSGQRQYAHDQGPGGGEAQGHIDLDPYLRHHSDTQDLGGGETQGHVDPNPYVGHTFINDGSGQQHAGAQGLGGGESRGHTEHQLEGALDLALQPSPAQIPAYFRPSDTLQIIPEYSPISITIVNPHPVNSAIAERMSDVLNWAGPTQSSHMMPNRGTSPQTLRSPQRIPQIPTTPRTKHKASHSTTPADRTVPQSAMFRLLRVEEGGGNPIYETKCYAAGMDDLHDWLALPNGDSSTEAKVTLPKTGIAVVKVTIRRALGWQFVVLNILYFRAFYFQIISIPAVYFPPDLPKDDVIDGGLVRMLTSWVSTMLAMRVCAGRTPAASEVTLFTKTCLDSLEATVVISIVAQFNLSEFSVQDIEEQGWRGLFKTVPGKLDKYYEQRVGKRVEENVLQFHLGANHGNLDHTLDNMHQPQICPDLAFMWGAPYKAYDLCLHATTLSSNLHLVLSNPSKHKYMNDHSKHGIYTQQEGTDEAAETIAKVHDMVEDGVPIDQKHISLFRNVLIDLGTSNIIGYYARAVPLALVRTFQEDANPWLDSPFSKKFPYIGLLPYVVGNVNAAFCSLQHLKTNPTADQIICSAHLELASTQKGQCMKALLDHFCKSSETAASNIADLEWLNKTAQMEALSAIRSLDESHQTWRGRAEYLVWDPLIPWLSRAHGFKQDILSLYEKLGSTPAPTEEGEIANGHFPQSPLTKLYDEVLAEWKEKQRIWAEKRQAKAEEQGSVSEPLEESLGTAIIFKMTHITEETAGAAWPMIRAGLKRARHDLKADKKDFEQLLRQSGMPKAS